MRSPSPTFIGNLSLNYCRSIWQTFSSMLILHSTYFEYECFFVDKFLHLKAVIPVLLATYNTILQWKWVLEKKRVRYWFYTLYIKLWLLLSMSHYIFYTNSTLYSSFGIGIGAETFFCQNRNLNADKFSISLTKFFERFCFSKV